MTRKRGGGLHLGKNFNSSMKKLQKLFFRFFTKKNRETTTSAERVKKTVKTVEPIGWDTETRAQARSIGVSNTILQRQPTIKQSQVKITYF